MKPILILSLIVLWTFSAFGQQQREIVLDVNGVGAYASYATVLKKLGKPSSSTPLRRSEPGEDCAPTPETTVSLDYSGLSLNLQGDGSGRKIKVMGFFVKSKKWNVSGVFVGATVKEVLAKFGAPIGGDPTQELSKTNGKNVLNFAYPVEGSSAALTLKFEDDKLAEISWEDENC